MVVVSTIVDLQSRLDSIKKLSIGFVPTMGALHQGHISLVKKSIEENDITVVSIFVNPTQFNDKNDFQKYPRTLEQDASLLEKVGVDIIFAPTEKEIYPEPDTRKFDFGMLDKVMEGKFRPGHFNGVAQVVSKLFDIVKPNKAYFGEKDFQQLAIIRTMVKQLNLPLEIVGMPIMREQSGLAMSSRNERLTAEERAEAAIIYKQLSESLKYSSDHNIEETIKYVTEGINDAKHLEVEYFDIVDGNTLQPITDWNSTDYIVGCIAVFCGNVRLIDNITYKRTN
ncbi:pantoate--beta-alanine ligase [Dysgonomonas sp. 216]|uniref:pantoate--beta-alanine ligase n=1 Tax=Dysgonomonas sp. 216 TaxID=2302934 RepID=UPI0013D84B33|nr:pantoate--beta-alanine ligase [Dysgonomonas sp. 216]NDW19510.1 pantoate--beta-alanine ligase [Dysgonomonas sp. 216]